MKLEVNNAYFKYVEANPILEDINFVLEDGQFLCVLGQNGIGKTTFLKCLTGILKWESGHVKFKVAKMK